MVATVFKLHRRSGGDLPSVLDGVATTLRERAAQTRESQSLTAQARLSGLVLGFLPIGFFCFLSVMSPQDMAAAYRTPAGVGAISMGVLLQAGAFMWIRHLLRVED
jgi:tight adherence protein B